MNAQQMKSAISRFRKADVSAIKDAKLRAKAQKLQAKQSGFTLLELLIVITLLATLATAGLVAYEGIGENAQDTAAAQNILLAESSIRNYRAIEDAYPNQWDNLANLDGTTSTTTGVQQLLAPQTQAFLGQWTIDTSAPSAVATAVVAALDEVGMDAFQTLDTATLYGNGAIPNLSWNESAVPAPTAGGASELEFDYSDASAAISTISYDETAVTTGNVALSIYVSGGEDGTGADSTCTTGTGTGPSISTPMDGGAAVTDNSALNLINDGLSGETCSLVIAVGYGKDVPGTTLDSRVAISQVPTASTENVNPANNYARYIALFQVAADDDNSTIIEADEVFSKPRLIGIIDPEGRNVDTALAGANEDA
jgi:prepilin-type N-terminal cleavage/methylation domain-containing protein